MRSGAPAPWDEVEPPDLAEWLKHNNAPKCRDCGGRTEPTGNQDGDEAEFRCVEFQCPVSAKQRALMPVACPTDCPGETEGCRTCRATWANIRPLSQREKETP